MLQTLLQNRYKILNTIGRGGMGAVYLALDQRLGNKVAIKQILINGSVSFGTRELLKNAFEKEAQLLANLRHKNLPKVSDHFIENNGQFLVMELITGKDLAELLIERNSPFSLIEVLGWLEQLLDVLDYIHTQPLPIIHRDIKPNNIKLTPRGEVILLDFGLAKGKTNLTGSKTQDKSVLGYTPGYAPLEQIQGSGTDSRSDLYSLGATLYHLLTNQAPTDVLTRVERLVAQKEDPLIAIEKLNGQIPQDIASVITKAMSISREHRYFSANEMRQAFQLNKSVKEMGLFNFREIETTNPSANKTTDSLHNVDNTQQTKVVTAPNLKSNTIPETKVNNDEKQVSNKTIPETKLDNGREPSSKAVQDTSNIPNTRLEENTLSKELKTGLSELPYNSQSKVNFLTNKIAIILLVLVFVGLGSWVGWTRIANKENGLSTNAIQNQTAVNVPTSKTNEAIAPILEQKKMLRCWLELMSDKKVSPQIDKKTLIISQIAPGQIAFGQNFRLHFISQQPGYLYILGSGKDNKTTTFLTTKPIAASKVKTNFIKDGIDFTFPGGENWLVVEKNNKGNKFIIIFSPSLVKSPNFLDIQAGHELTSEELQELDGLLQLRKSTSINELGEIISTSSSKATLEQVVVFDIEL